MSGRRFIGVIGAVLIVAVSGCTRHDNGHPQTVGSAPGTLAPSNSAPAPGSVLQLPAGAAVLVPVHTGRGGGQLPAFRSAEGGYTILLACTGSSGTIHVKPNGGTGDTAPCDGVPWVYRVFKATGEQHVMFDADESASWSAGVVDGAPKVS